jgi:hypothetical protein
MDLRSETGHVYAPRARRSRGEVAERSKAAVLKTARAKALEGSNPSLSASAPARRGRRRRVERTQRAEFSKTRAADGSAYIVELVAGLLYLPAAAPLLHLAARTGQLPERLLGWNFACMGSSYVLYAAPSVLSLEAETPWYAVGRVVYAVGCTLVAMFARRVFRPRGRWPGLVAWCRILVCAGGIAVSCLAGDPAGFSLADPMHFEAEQEHSGCSGRAAPATRGSRLSP